MKARANEEAVRAQLESRGIIEVPEHGEFSRGDVVQLTGERGTFVIQSIRIFPDGTLNYVTLWGGMKGREMYRSVTNDRIKPQRRRSSKRG